MNKKEQKKFRNPKWINEPTDISNYQGFVYIIENTITHKKYIGKKAFWFKRKNKKTGRRVTKESDWKTYYGSCDGLIEDINKLGEQRFTRTILYLCVYKKQMTYLEQKEQWKREVLTSDDYYNTNIGGKFFVYDCNIYEGKPRIVGKNKKWREEKSESMKGDNNVSKRPDVRAKISAKKKGKNHHQYGKPISKEHKDILINSKTLIVYDGDKEYNSQGEYLKEKHIGYVKYKKLLEDGKITIKKKT